MGRFEIILWDVDQTLLDFNRSQEYALCYIVRADQAQESGQESQGQSL